MWTGLGRSPKIRRDVASIAVEFVSAGRRNRERDYIAKRKEYMEAGIKEYWIVDRFQRTMTVVRNGPTGPQDQVVREHDLYQSPFLRALTYRSHGCWPQQTVPPKWPDARRLLRAWFHISSSETALAPFAPSRQVWGPTARLTTPSLPMKSLPLLGPIVLAMLALSVPGCGKKRRQRQADRRLCHQPESPRFGTSREGRRGRCRRPQDQRPCRRPDAERGDPRNPERIVQELLARGDIKGIAISPLKPDVQADLLDEIAQRTEAT